MNDYFDFYSVHIYAKRKGDLYHALGGKTEDIRKKIKTNKLGMKNGYPVKEYEYVVGYVDIANIGAVKASERAEKIAEPFRTYPLIRTYVKYHCRWFTIF